MDEWVITTFDSFSYPRLRTETVHANDIEEAIGLSTSDKRKIICVKIKAPIATGEQ